MDSHVSHLSSLSFIFPLFSRHLRIAVCHSEYPGEYLQWNMNLDEWAALRRRMRPFPELFRFDDQVCGRLRVTSACPTFLFSFQLLICPCNGRL